MPRILVVDDDSLVLKTILRILRGAGYTVDAAANLEEGFQSFEGNDYDQDC